MNHFNENRPAGALQFRQPGAGNFSIEKQQDGKYSVRLIAFSGKEFSHWWWGRCIFDRSGVVLEHDKIPIDFDHDPTEGVGYLDTFSGETELSCGGFLLPFKEGDRANEIIAKKENGMPYQCSVSLGDLFEWEYVKPGQFAEVNGITVEGGVDGIMIFRKFSVIGVAICLYGSDSNTAVFNNSNNNKGENLMGTTIEPNKTKDDSDAGRQLYKKYVTKFGVPRGGKYFADGLSEDQANDAYIEDVSSEVTEKDKRIAELEAKVSELEKAVAEKDKRIAELEAQQSGEGEAAAVNSEEFKKLQEENKRFKAAGGNAGGESSPVSAGGVDSATKKEFSPLPENLRKFGAKVKQQFNV